MRKAELRTKVVNEFKSLVFGPRSGKDEFIQLYPKYEEPETTDEEKKATKENTRFRKQVKQEAQAF